MSNTQSEKKPNVLTDRVRVLVAGIVTPIGEGLHKIGIHPDMMTILGLIMVLIGTVFIARGQLRIGGLMLLIALPVDALDGAIARAMKRTGKFGAMLDSAMDRYADGFIFAALSYYFAEHDQMNMMLVAQVALIGSLLVSYVRARAGGLRVDTKVGIFTRMERAIVILVILFFPVFLEWGVLILAIGTNITALQRLWFVYRTLKNRGS